MKLVNKWHRNLANVNKSVFLRSENCEGGLSYLGKYSISCNWEAAQWELQDIDFLKPQ